MSKQTNQKPNKEVKSLVKSIFTRLFGFDTNIDIASNFEVLKRKNYVIKNIIFLFNIFFFLLMTIYSVLSWTALSWNQSNTFLKVNKIANWVIMISTFPLTFIINYFLKRIIIKQESDEKVAYHNQVIAMYFSVVYLFIAPLLFYIKINLMWEVNTSFKPVYQHTFETFSYLTFYVSLILCSLYSDKKLMINASLIMLSILSIMHFLVTHNFIYVFSKLSGHDRLIPIIDISLRYFVYTIFVIILISITSRSHQIEKLRQQAVISKESIEADFIRIADNINLFLEENENVITKRNDIENIKQLSLYLATLIGLSKEEKDMLENECLLLAEAPLIIDQGSMLRASIGDTTNFDYEVLKELTFKASAIMQKIQLSTKIEQMIRHILIERNYHFVIKFEFNTIIDQIIFISELYYILRTPSEYKSPMRHVDAIGFIKDYLPKNFDQNIKQLFMQFSDDFNKLYLEFN